MKIISVLLDKFTLISNILPLRYIKDEKALTRIAKESTNINRSYAAQVAVDKMRLARFFEGVFTRGFGLLMRFLGERHIIFAICRTVRSI